MPVPAARTFTADTGTTLIALAASTPKTVLNVIAPAAGTTRPTTINIGFDGTTASDGPVKVELCSCSQTTSGTSTAVTIFVRSGHGTMQATAQKNYSVEPTVLTTIETWTIDPYKGSLILPIDDGLESAIGGGIALRCTAAANVNCHAALSGGE